MKRHGYYCRSRRIGSTPRPRSCVSCAKSKVRCDGNRPRCARCLAKSIDCVFPGRESQDAINAPKARKTTLSPVLLPSKPQAATESFQAGLEDAVSIFNPDFVGAQEQYVDWDDPKIDFANFYDPKWTGVPVLQPRPRSSLSPPYLTPSTDEAFQLTHPTSPPSLSILTLPVDLPRSLVKRPKVNLGAQRTAMLIQHTLKSYLVMVLRENSLPPYIHPSMLALYFENNDTEPLVNSLSLIHMLTTEVRGSRKIFWKNVRIECERFYNEASCALSRQSKQ